MSAASAACGTAHDRRPTVVSQHVRRVVVRHEWCHRDESSGTPRGAQQRRSSRRRSSPFRTTFHYRTHRRMAAPRGVQQRRPAVVAHRVDARARAKQLRNVICQCTTYRRHVNVMLARSGCATNNAFYYILHYITSHYIAVQFTTLHYITLHCITLHRITLHHATLSRPARRPPRGRPAPRAPSEARRPSARVMFHHIDVRIVQYARRPSRRGRPSAHAAARATDGSG